MISNALKCTMEKKRKKEKKKKSCIFVYFRPKYQFFYLTIEQGPQKSICAAGAKFPPAVQNITNANK